MLRGMLWRVAVLLLGGGFVVYRVALWRQIRQARRSGDLERERWLRGRDFRVARWIAVVVIVFLLLFTVLVWRNSG